MWDKRHKMQWNTFVFICKFILPCFFIKMHFFKQVNVYLSEQMATPVCDILFEN